MPFSPTVLVAEDDSSDVALLQRAIKKANVEVRFEFVYDGGEAMDYLQAKPPFDNAGAPPPAVLLLDLKMPRVDGFEVLEWLQHRPELRPPTVAVFSSSGVTDDIRRTSRLGVDHYFVKPCDLNELIWIVKIIERYCQEDRATAAGAEQAEETLRHTAAA
ncbi:MAG TPA: response regulator [Candidatus Binatia bacterium]|jgi:CheY-like chemotaxis protein|nr:response regulator [Candidatus Binatia bacterium]